MVIASSSPLILFVRAAHVSHLLRKVCIILKELDIPYDYKIVEFSEVKQEPYTSINPNGRLPAIEDPNTGVKLWEVSYVHDGVTLGLTFTSF